MKKSFLLHLDSLNILSELTAEQAGEFFKAIYNYHLSGELPTEFWLKLALTPFVNQWERDSEKWERVKQVRKESGRKGGLMKAQNNPNNPLGYNETESKQMLANAKNANQTLANVAVNDNVNVNVNVSGNVKKEKTIKKENPPPTLEDVKAWFIEQGSTAEQGAKAWQYYTDGNWHDAKGQPVKNWRQKMRGGRWLEVKAQLPQTSELKTYKPLNSYEPEPNTEINDFTPSE
jgi:hypothetical protein